MEIVVPDLGESIVEATIARWLKKEGEPVKLGEPVVELETDKVDLEVGAKQEGILVRIAHQEGDDVKVGEVLGTIEAGPAPAQAASAGPVGAGTQENTHETVSVSNQPTVQVSDSPSPVPSNGQAEESPKEAETTQGSDERVTPVAKRIAQERGLDLSKIPGTGFGDRVTKEDVQQYLQSQPKSPEVAQKTTEVRTETQPTAQTAPAQKPSEPVEAPAPVFDSARREERVRLSRRRRTIASRLVEAQHTAAMLTTFNDVDMSAVMELRQRRREAFLQKHGVKLGFMSFFVKASIGSLKEFPQVNAEIQGGEIILKHYYDIGIAIGAEEGLVVPVLHDADRMSFAQIEKTIQDFTQKAQNGTLSLDDLRGGTFTITNGGVFGSLLSTPILNPPQVAILGMHRIEERPVAINSQVVVRPMMYLALSYDHRIVDGREAVQFLVRVKELIQDPEALLLEG